MSNKEMKENVAVFSHDIAEKGSYAYTTDRLSSVLANKRISEAFNSIYPLKGKRLLDIGCGDGAYSLELVRYGAEFVLGVDPSEAAVAAASYKAEQQGLTGKIAFQPGNIYNLQMDMHFDCIVLRGVIHHLPDAAKALKAIATLADTLLIMEPNGTNPVVKIIEKTSRYHIEHEEQSFLLSTLKKWLMDAGYKHLQYDLVNLVPMFCPDWMARLCKMFEPFVEAVPLVRNIACGQYIILASKSESRK